MFHDTEVVADEFVELSAHLTEVEQGGDGQGGQDVGEDDVIPGQVEKGHVVWMAVSSETNNKTID